MTSTSQQTQKKSFFLLQMLKGFAWLAGLIGIFLVLRYSFGINFQHIIENYADKPIMVYFIFLISEIVFGIIPPEVFMLWAAGSSHIAPYGFLMLYLGIISYIAGVMGYYLGKALQKTRFYEYIHKLFLSRYTNNLKRYGYFLIIVAALTPVPFSAICMLVGAVGYARNKFLAFASFRFLRFSLYAWIMLEISNLWFLV